MPHPTPDQAFRKLLRILVEVQKTEWQQEENRVSSYSRLRENVSRKLIQFQSQYLTLDRDPLDIVSENHQLISLPPLRRDTHLVPFLTLFHDGIVSDISCCRLYVLLLGFNRNQGGQNEVYGIGFRIESPERNCSNDEGNSRVGSHDFYHAQYVLNLSKYKWPDFYRTFPQLPESQPSFPLWAIQPVDALLNLVLTLYGAEYYLNFLRNHASGYASTASDEFKILNRRLASTQR